MEEELLMPKKTNKKTEAKSAVERIKEHPLHDIGETWKLFHQISSPIEPP